MTSRGRGPGHRYVITIRSCVLVYMDRIILKSDIIVFDKIPSYYSIKLANIILFD